ncbi:MAG TPA: PEP-CTERM sorting domain-containing protein [Pirellulales bacterium]|nr:PEP-CTERM sorting domain-containing protein [Pirellulales bacterium]
MRFLNTRAALRTLIYSAAVFALPSLSLAGPVSSVGDLYQTGGNQITQFKITSFEEVVDSSGNELSSNATIGVGDRFIGILNVTTSQTTSGNNSLSPVGFQLTGVYDVTVNAVAGSDGATSFQITPTTSFANTLAVLSNVQAAGGTSSNLQNTMIGLFVGNTVNFSDGGTIAQGIANAETGTFYAGVGATGTWGSGYYWQALGPNTVAANANATTTFTGSLGMIFNNTGLTFIPDQHVPPSAAADNFGFSNAQLNGILNQVIIKGSTTANGDFGITSQWPLVTQDPVQVHAVPEPASLALWGLMGTSLCLFRRRRAG